MLSILPASGQEHGLFDEDGARQEDVPTTSNVIRTKRAKRAQLTQSKQNGWIKTLHKGKGVSLLFVQLQHLQDLKITISLYASMLDYKSYIGDAILFSLHLQWEVTCSFTIWITF